MSGFQIFEDSVSSPKHVHVQHVMKLFDRKIDVGKFKNSTPLYPICRDWIRNNVEPEKHS